MATEQKSNPLNTSWNKTTYTVIFNALFVFLVLSLEEFLKFKVSPTWQAAAQALITTAIPIFVQNKEPPA